MSMLKNLFGHSTTGQTQGLSSDLLDAAQQAHLAQLAQYQQTEAQYRQTMMQAQNAARNLTIGAQGMAGASGALGLGMATNTYQPQTWGQQLSPTQIRDVTRNHIANQVEKMAEEIGAPTLLHAVVLAIRTMEIPE